VLGNVVGVAQVRVLSGPDMGWVWFRYGVGVVKVWCTYIRRKWPRYVVGVAQACGGFGPGMARHMAKVWGEFGSGIRWVLSRYGVRALPSMGGGCGPGMVRVWAQYGLGVVQEWGG
jgi:hypothetical protein